jgi:hypothetical protein
MAFIHQDPEAFLQILRTCGLSQRVSTFFTERVGATLSDIIILSKDDFTSALDAFAKSGAGSGVAAANRFYLNTTTTVKLHTIRYWAQIAFLYGGAQYESGAMLPTINPEWIANLTLSEYGPQGYNRNVEDVITDIVKYDGNNWLETKNSLHRHLESRYGSTGVQLTYLIRESRIPFDEVAHSSLNEVRVATHSHQGADYHQDNNKLYTILHSHFKGSSLGSIVRKFEKKHDGRAAWLEILAHCEGGAFTEEMASKARSILQDSFYDGKSKTFSFEDYYKRQVNAHNMLLEINQPLSEQEKLLYFAKGIRDPTIKSTYLSARQNPQYANSFQQMYGFINSGIRIFNPKSLPTDHSGANRRLLNPVLNRGGGAEGGGKTPRGGRGGRFGGRQGRGGRNNGGRGRNSERGAVECEKLPNHLDPSRQSFLPTEEWNRLTPGQKRTWNLLKHNKVLTVNAVDSNPPAVIHTDAASAISETGTRDNRSTQSNQAGSAFGRQSRN